MDEGLVQETGKRYHNFDFHGQQRDLGKLKNALTAWLDAIFRCRVYTEWDHGH